MKIKKNVLFFISIAVFIICVWEVIIPYTEFGKGLYDDRICRNLINSGYFQGTEDCYFSDRISEVMGKTFPDQSVDIQFVTSAMEGFNQIHTSNFTYDVVTFEICNPGDLVTVLDYKISGGFFPVDNAYQTFYFCEDLLVDKHTSD
jgi:hypothetical protein